MLDEKDLQAIANLIDSRLEVKLAENNKALRKEIHEDFMTVIESEVMPKIQLIAEAQGIMAEKMISTDRIERIETDVFALKAAYKRLSEKVTALENAR